MALTSLLVRQLRELLVVPASLRGQRRPRVATKKKPQKPKLKAIKMEAMKCGEADRVHWRGSSGKHADYGEIKVAET